MHNSIIIHEETQFLIQTASIMNRHNSYRVRSTLYSSALLLYGCYSGQSHGVGLTLCFVSFCSFLSAVAMVWTNLTDGPTAAKRSRWEGGRFDGLHPIATDQHGEIDCLFCFPSVCLHLFIFSLTPTVVDEWMPRMDRVTTRTPEDEDWGPGQVVGWHHTHRKHVLRSIIFPYFRRKDTKKKNRSPSHSWSRDWHCTFLQYWYDDFFSIQTIEVHLYPKEINENKGWYSTK